LRSLGSIGHFGDERWAQFARGILEDPERAVMEDHVSSGCLKCLSTLSAARRAVDVKGRAGVGADSRAHSPLPVPSSGGSEWLASLSRPARLVFENMEVPFPPESERSGSH
jgi:hypothetical protein